MIFTISLIIYLFLSVILLYCINIILNFFSDSNLSNSIITIISLLLSSYYVKCHEYIQKKISFYLNRGVKPTRYFSFYPILIAVFSIIFLSIFIPGYIPWISKSSMLFYDFLYPLKIETLQVQVPSISNNKEYVSFYLRKIQPRSITFQMGLPQSYHKFPIPSIKNASGNEQSTSVSIKKDFYIGIYEVTQKQWITVMNNNPINEETHDCTYNHIGDNLPVYYISQEKCETFISQLNSRINSATKIIYVENKNYLFGGNQKIVNNKKIKFRLPSEAEWEYACKEGTNDVFFYFKHHPFMFYGAQIEAKLRNSGDIGPDEAQQVINILSHYYVNSKYSDERLGIPKAVFNSINNIRFPNSFGLYDMLGNVSEWVKDDWHDDIRKYPHKNKGIAWINANQSTDGIVKGGNCLSSYWDCRASYRIKTLKDVSDYEGSHYKYVGLRLAADIIE